MTGGSLLGAVRQHSILFCDDDIDVTIIDRDGTVYPKVCVHPVSGSATHRLHCQRLTAVVASQVSLQQATAFTSDLLANALVDVRSCFVRA